MVGTFDVLGNPAALLSDIGAGVHDFFWDPIEGLREGHSLAHGVAKVLR